MLNVERWTLDAVFHFWLCSWRIFNFQLSTFNFQRSTTTPPVRVQYPIINDQYPVTSYQSDLSLVTGYWELMIGWRRRRTQVRRSADPPLQEAQVPARGWASTQRTA